MFNQRSQVPAAPSRTNGSGPPEQSELALQQLFLRSGKGDPNARAALIERFLPLARQLARRYARSSEPFDDLFQVASLGLVKAVDRFDTDRGVAFSTYAVPTILGELKRHFRDTGWSVHVPRSLHEQALAVQRTERALANRLGRSPRVTDIAQELEITDEQVLAALDAGQAHDALSLDAPQEGREGERESLVSTIGSTDSRYELIEYGTTIEATMHKLPARDRRVLALRFGEDLTQSQIADQVGVSQMQVSRIIRRSLERLRELADQEPSTGAPAGV
ncbi:MAG: SigB/SigF/SigG family RNA polymerase sigma factor [Actinomycetota bacterium]|nr:SigB/SigF/SigG family RNA polymerase sigma factor [Actinomycetota bacterium]